MPLIHQSLFNRRFLEQRVARRPTPEAHKKILHDWAETIRGGLIHKQKESEIRGAFIQRFFVDLLGYTPFGSGQDRWTISDERRTGGGSADTALGFFDDRGKTVVAPVELKGADTPDLDAIMPGRYKSAVAQVWEYAMDTPGCRFMLVSNMIEIRLYAVGHTRQVCERFEILELADSDAAYWRFRLLLDADRLLTGATADLLKDSAKAEKEITGKLYADYKTWRIDLLIAAMQKSGKDAIELIGPVQKLLDRVLFIAFAEDRGLLPPKSLVNAGGYRDPYNPRPVWQNFLGLFRAIDKGNRELGIPAYNGGLFASDAALDELPISDEACRIFSEIGEYDFAEDVSVSVLGHIFEQSVSDLEQLRELAGSGNFTLETLEKEARAASALNGKRKEEGVVYTPDVITRFIADKTLGAYLERERENIRQSFIAADGGWRAPTKAESSAYVDKKKTRATQNAKLKDASRLVEFLFWMAWRERLQTVRVVDPACGSGAFLVAAFEVLDAEYHSVNEQIQAITGNPDLFDINREILNGNLYGVDLNPESIEITKLSLWLKTARSGKPLESLEANLCVGNSLIADAAWTDRPFDWRAVFPRVFAEGGFDVVLGNPPYVRMERLKAFKPYLEKNYAVASDRADLYCYFYELGVSLLKPGGHLGYISSSTFFKTGSGEPLRRYLLENSALKILIDFGDIQVFEGVTTYPAIVVLERGGQGGEIAYLALGREMPESLAMDFGQNAGVLPQSRLGAGSWQLEADAPADLRASLARGRKKLKEVYGSPCRGIVTGMNEAFVIDRATRDRLLARDPNSAKLLKPFLEGRDLKKWHVESRDSWLIYIPKNRIDIEEYPAVKAHLLPFRDRLEKRATKQEWFELQQAQEAYLEKFNAPKIYYPDISQGPKFSYANNGIFAGNTCYFIPCENDRFLLALLNSKLYWFQLTGQSDALRGGVWRLRLFAENVETLPIPDAPDDMRGAISTLAASAQTAAEERHALVRSFGRRVLTDLAPGGASSKLPAKLADWPALDFKAFHEAVKKHFKHSIPLTERDDWQALFEKNRRRVIELDAAIARSETQIDAAVYRLFDLTPEQIRLIEETAGRPPA